MALKTSSLLVVSTGVLIMWVASIAVLARVIPAPHRPADYLVMGAVATLIALLLLFVILLHGWVKADNVFFKRRTPPDRKTSAATDSSQTPVV